MQPSIHARVEPARGALGVGGVRGALRGALRRNSGRIGVSIVGLAVAAALLGPWLAPHDPFVISGGSLLSPRPDHPMGTDALGRDVLSGVLYGARTSLLVATAVSVVALACGTAVGLVAGYRGGWIDDALMRVAEIFQVIPRFFFAIVTLALFGPGLDRMVLALGMTSWPLLARVIRGEVRASRELDFVRAARALGAPAARVMRRQLLPQIAPTVTAVVGPLYGQVLLLEATLGFLGLGDPGAISWGSMAAQAQGLMRVAWWLALFPGLAITLTVVGVNLLADGLTLVRPAD